MPESPEVQALVEDLDARLRRRVLAGVDVLEFRVVKTRDRPLTELLGVALVGVERHGKLVDLVFDGGRHLVVSLGRHGWARYAGGDADASGVGRDLDPVAGGPPALFSLAFDGGPLVEFTDAGEWVSLAAYLVDDPSEVAAVAKLGPDPAAPRFTRAEFDRVFVGRRKQTKAVLQEQESLAGIGNAYSDEILHLAKLSPVAHAATLGPDELDRLFAGTVGVITDAIAARRGIPIDRLKATKVAAMRVHGRAGESCPVCGDTIREFSFASTTAEYCPTCQTGGEILPLKE